MYLNQESLLCNEKQFRCHYYIDSSYVRKGRIKSIYLVTKEGEKKRVCNKIEKKRSDCWIMRETK